MINLAGGRHSLEQALEEYHVAWHAFLNEFNLSKLGQAFKPTTLSWKVADRKALFENLASLGGQTEQVHIGTVDNRFIASIVLKDSDVHGMKIIKILERRPGSSDPLGLDSIDYLVEDIDAAFHKLKAAKAHIEHQTNAMHDWLSLRFGQNNQYEAKLTDHLVLEVAIKELKSALDSLT
ncbi:MAG TPA: hypothetical protein VLG37_00535 [Candidatus Saccharimonadales bacterium]|nr:hypothetical protein [Candidatus Saccharimonadales bacterium]